MGHIRNTGICLNMIVKNEAPVIRRLLESVKTSIDYYIIVDTGSTDGTPDLIQTITKELKIPGKIFSRPWVNFGHNRQEALDLAINTKYIEWLLIIDADEELEYTDTRWWNQMIPGITYRLEKQHKDLNYSVNNLIWAKGIEWKWHGVVHEYIYPNINHPQILIKNARIISHPGEGNRSQKYTQEQKFLQDAELLKVELKKNPNDARSQFYLAQSYRDAGHLEKAYKHYLRRTNMQGWDEETFIAHNEIANLSIYLKHKYESIINNHIRAWSMRPTRAEPLWQVANYCRYYNKFPEGYLFSKIGKDIPIPINDVLFIITDIYKWKLLDEFSICAYQIGQYKEAIEACEKILENNILDHESDTRIRTNLELFSKKI
jgi:glycosyltransferase involved in cell wall biosynthesis